MSKVVIDCEAITQIAESLNNYSNQLSELASTVASYSVGGDSEFDFASAIAAIASNISACGERIKGASSVLCKVVEEHSNVQNSMKYSPNVQTSKADGTSSVANDSDNTNMSSGTYSVKSGDTLSEIATANGVTLEALLAANTIENKNLIHVGDSINIPGGITTSTNTEKKEETKTTKETNKNAETTAEVNYKTKSVNGTRTVKGESGCSVNEVLTKIKKECEKQGIGEYWQDACAISLWETGTYTSKAFANNNVGGMSPNGKDRMTFNSLDAGIEKFVGNLNKNYISQGMTSIDSMAKKYCPPTASSWATNVKQMKNQINNS